MEVVEQSTGGHVAETETAMCTSIFNEAEGEVKDGQVREMDQDMFLEQSEGDNEMETQIVWLLTIRNGMKMVRGSIPALGTSFYPWERCFTLLTPVHPNGYGTQRQRKNCWLPKLQCL